METAGAGILPDVSGAPDAETLARLRRQRGLVRELRDAVEVSGRRLAGREAGPAWRSPAQRAYGTGLVELSATVQSAWRALDDALWAVDEAIERVKAAL